ncbi:MAG: hypothetical protein ACYTGX_04340 [Planctomycetota bacterium]|jgi:hypothetical protein
MRQLLLALVLLTGLLASGCATIFSGFSQDVTLTSDVEGAQCIVLSGTVGTALSVASGVSDLSQKVFDLMDPMLEEGDRAMLRQADLNELITYGAIAMSEVEIPKELDSTMRFLKRIPKSVWKRVMELFYIVDVGPFPREVELRRARTSAIVVWAPGHKADVITVHGYRFNLVVLWNLITIIPLGIIVDAATGAWGKYPSVIPITLEPRR